MSPKTPTAAEARLEARKKAKRLALKILRRRRTILNSIHRFSEEFGLRAYVHLEKKSRHGSYDVYSSHDPMHSAIAKCYPLPNVYTPANVATLWKRNAETGRSM